MTKMIIAEKPSVARDIAKVLKCNKKGDGFIYNDEYIISWAIGHLVSLCEPDEYDKKYKKWDIATLPIMPDKLQTKAISNTKAQFEVLKKIMNSSKVDSLICATDSGREGELIFRYIYELAHCTKPFQRLWISSMTDDAIKDGFNKLKDGTEYDNLYKSAKCRSEADWLVGINSSRAFTIKYNALLSIGRVQTPTLAIIVNRQKEIDEFVPVQYYEIEADFDAYKGLWIDLKNDSSKINDKKTVDEIINKVKNKAGIVDLIENEEKKTPPPLLYDLTELQRDCNKKYGFSAQKTLSIAQDLYEKRKMITYPRTDSRYLSDDMISKLKKIVARLNNADAYNSYSKYVLSLDKLPITKRIVDNSKISDHHAIIPTDSAINTHNLSDVEFKVFDLIARRFLAVFYPYYVYSTTKIITSVNNEMFITRGTTVIDKGWTQLNLNSDSDKKKEEVLPNVKKGDEFNVKSVKSSLKKTKPPKMYNEASLLSAMENAGRFVDDENIKEQLKESGLGTPATRASIIERLIKVGYIVRKGKNLVPTEKGIKLIEIVPNELKSPETTGKWEKGLTSIAKGAMSDEKFMDSIKRYVNYIVTKSKQDEHRVIFAADKPKGKKVSSSILGLCPNCQGHILENTKAFYCSNWKQGCKFTIWKNSLEKQGIEINKEITVNLLKNKTVEISDKSCIIKLNDNLGNLIYSKVDAT